MALSPRVLLFHGTDFVVTHAPRWAWDWELDSCVVVGAWADGLLPFFHVVTGLEADKLCCWYGLLPFFHVVMGVEAEKLCCWHGLMACWLDFMW
jgi:hypothetical protein